MEPRTSAGKAQALRGGTLNVALAAGESTLELGKGELISE